MFENIFSKFSKTEKTLQHKDDEEVQERINLIIDTRALSEEMESTLFQNKRLIEVLARLVIELEDKITEYDTVLSDDASGRLVSLFLKQIIDKKREGAGKDKAQIYFVARGRGRFSNEKRDSAVEKFITDKGGSFGKTLLVTEHIVSGESIAFLIEILEQQNIDFDTATISVYVDPKDYSNNYASKIGDYIKRAGIKYGEIGDIGETLHYKPGFSGVKKPVGHELAHPKKAEEFDDPEKSRVARKDIKRLKFDPEKIRTARRDIKRLGEELSKLIS